jgi:hypothetical protein
MSSIACLPNLRSLELENLHHRLSGDAFAALGRLHKVWRPPPPFFLSKRCRGGGSVSGLGPIWRVRAACEHGLASRSAPLRARACVGGVVRHSVKAGHALACARWPLCRTKANGMPRGSKAVKGLWDFLGLLLLCVCVWPARSWST